MNDIDAVALRIGWSAADITPPEPVLLRGQMHIRVSEGVRDPITATALVLNTEAADTRRSSPVVLISCDLVAISDDLRNAVCAAVQRRLPDIKPDRIILNATHTHTAPYIARADLGAWANPSSDGLQAIGIQLGVDVMDPAEYVAFAAQRIADAVIEAWEHRQPGGVSWGLTGAVISHNRRWTDFDGVSTMYGNTNTPTFSHIEGWEDHSLQMLCTWNVERELTGVVVNVPCPSQVSESEFEISADFWHEARNELRARLGTGLFVLPQCSPAGDLSPHRIVGKDAAARMLCIKGQTRRDEIATCIADAVEGVVPLLESEVVWSPVLEHRVETLQLARRPLTAEDVEKARSEAHELKVRYQEALRALESDPDLRNKKRWYVGVSAAYGRAAWCQRVIERYNHPEPTYPAQVHVVRLGELIIATNPFEYYVDYGLYIKTRSRAEQTFLVQLAGRGTYLPTQRAAAAGGYGAVPASTVVGPEGGRQLAERTVGMINEMWAESQESQRRSAS